MAVLGATGKRRFRPEGQTRARPSQHNEALRATRRPETRTWPPMPAQGLKGPFQQNEVREQLETPRTTAKTRHALKSALQA